MSLRFTDKEGRPLSLEDWQTKIRDVQYCKPVWSERGIDWEIEAAWIGVYSSTLEKEPRPFIVQQWRLEKKVSESPNRPAIETTARVEIKDREPRWCKTAEEARGMALTLAALFKEKR